MLILVVSLRIILLFSEKENLLDLFSTFHTLTFSISTTAVFLNLHFMCCGPVEYSLRRDTGQRSFIKNWFNSKLRACKMGVSVCLTVTNLVKVCLLLKIVYDYASFC